MVVVAYDMPYLQAGPYVQDKPYLAGSDTT